jgi:quercetin dioxygenase-like cupin family protein
MSTLKEQAAALGITGEPFFVGEGFAKAFRIPAGRLIGQHDHKSAHLGMLALGSVRVVDPHGSADYTAPATITIPAGMPHEIVALTDALWLCVWPDADGAITEEDFERKVIA